MFNARIVLATLSVFIAAGSLSFGASYTLNGSVDRWIEPVGDPTYRFVLFLRNFDPTAAEDVVLEMVSPTGMRFGERMNAAGDAVQILLDGILSADINSLVSGTWIIEETINGGSLNRYEFTIPQILDSARFPSTPTILSPTDGSIVGKEFALVYSNPSPTGFGLSIDYANPTLQGVRPRRTSSLPGELSLSFADIPGIGGETISRLSVANVSVNLQFLNPIPLNAGANSRFDENDLIAGNFGFSSFSAPVSLKIIPEPGTILLLGLATLCATSVRDLVRINQR